MGLFSKKIHFYTLHIGEKAIDYPKHMPIPRVGEKVMYEGVVGYVSNVIHITASRFVSEIKIICSEKQSP